MRLGTARHALTLPPRASPGEVIGLLGGSFNPPHPGHRHITLEAMKRLGLDRVWWVVTPGNPLKDHSDLETLPQRIALAEQAVQHPRVVVTGFEVGLQSAFTAQTIEHLLIVRPGVQFVWLMGADNLAGFHRWRAWEEIAASVPIGIFDRPGWRYRALASPAAHRLASERLPNAMAPMLKTLVPPVWAFLDIPLSHYSSSAIRLARRQGG